MTEGFHWQRPDLDEATLREMRHFDMLRAYLFEQEGEPSYATGLSSRSTENTEEYTIIYRQWTDEVYRVSDTSIEQIAGRPRNKQDWTIPILVFITAIVLLGVLWLLATHGLH